MGLDGWYTQRSMFSDRQNESTYELPGKRLFQSYSNTFSFRSSHQDERGRNVEVWDCECATRVHVSVDDVEPCGVRVLVVQPWEGDDTVFVHVLFEADQEKRTVPVYQNAVIHSYAPAGTEVENWEVAHWQSLEYCPLVAFSQFVDAHSHVDVDAIPEVTESMVAAGVATHLLGPGKWTRVLGGQRHPFGNEIRKLALTRGTSLNVLHAVDDFLVAEAEENGVVNWEGQWRVLKLDGSTRDLPDLVREIVQERLGIDRLYGLHDIDWAVVFPDREESDWWGFESWPVRAELVRYEAVRDDDTLMEGYDVGPEMRAVISASEAASPRVRMLASI